MLFTIAILILVLPSIVTRWLGKEFETGLANLKALAEQSAAQTAAPARRSA
jgi:hypothetical protein